MKAFCLRLCAMQLLGDRKEGSCLVIVPCATQANSTYKTILHNVKAISLSGCDSYR